MRCPLAQMKAPVVQVALDLFAEFRRGITPQGRGARHETSAYRAFMRTCEALGEEAKAWYQRKAQDDARRRAGRG